MLLRLRSLSGRHRITRWLGLQVVDAPCVLCSYVDNFAVWPRVNIYCYLCRRSQRIKLTNGIDHTYDAVSVGSSGSTSSVCLSWPLIKHLSSIQPREIQGSVSWAQFGKGKEDGGGQ